MPIELFSCGQRPRQLTAIRRRARDYQSGRSPTHASGSRLNNAEGRIQAVVGHAARGYTMPHFLRRYHSVPMTATKKRKKGHVSQ